MKAMKNKFKLPEAGDCEPKGFAGKILSACLLLLIVRIFFMQEGQSTMFSVIGIAIAILFYLFAVVLFIHELKLYWGTWRDDNEYFRIAALVRFVLMTILCVVITWINIKTDPPTELIESILRFIRNME